MAPSVEFAGPFWLGFAQETNGIAKENWLIPQDRSHRISSYSYSAKRYSVKRYSVRRGGRYSYSMAVGTAAMPIGIEENAIEENATVQGS